MNTRRKIGSILLLIMLCLFVANTASANDLPKEVTVLKQKFEENVSLMPFSDEHENMLADHAFSVISNTHEGLPDSSQFFLLVDRNPNKQTASLAFFNARKQNIVILGTTKTSTGKASRRGSFETPVGVFRNTVNNPSYRALGTKNDKGWRGLGAQGSRVWDLGWQKTKTRKGEDFDIRLLVHATDPDSGEQRLGKQDSQGCIRISAKFNRFLDYYGILDALYEKNDKAKWVLLKQREPTPFAGNLVVVVNTAT